jgi:hypothetical protein
MWLMVVMGRLARTGGWGRAAWMPGHIIAGLGQGRNEPRALTGLHAGKSPSFALCVGMEVYQNLWTGPPAPR